MVARKLNKVGGNTLTVSVPASWVKKNKLKSGDEIELEEKSGGLFLYAKRDDFQEEEITITINKEEDYARRLIINPYVQGYNLIRINFKDPKISSRIIETMNHLIGFEIIMQKENTIVIKNIAKGIEEEFKTLFHRMIHLLKIIGITLVDCIDSSDKEGLNEISSLDFNLGKLKIFCSRILATQMNEEIRKILEFYKIVITIEEIGDIYHSISKVLKSRKIILENKDSIKTIVKLCNEAIDLTQKRNPKKIVENTIALKNLAKELNQKDNLIDGKLASACDLIRELTVVG